MNNELIETNDAIQEIEVIGVELVSECIPGEVCKPSEFFEMINQCALCGKLS